MFLPNTIFYLKGSRGIPFINTENVLVFDNPVYSFITKTKFLKTFLRKFYSNLPYGFSIKLPLNSVVTFIRE